VIKLLDTVLQSLEQMRTLPLVDESSDLGAAVDIRISYTKARR
jgi:signal recognition particle subunit SRP68